MDRLICIFDGRTYAKVRFLTLWLICFYYDVSLAGGRTSMRTVSLFLFLNCIRTKGEVLREKIYCRLSLSRSQSDTLKYFEMSVGLPLHIKFAELRTKINRIITFHKCRYVTWLLKLEIYRKYCGKEEKLLLLEQFLLFSTIFCYLLSDFYDKEWAKFSHRDKRLF